MAHGIENEDSAPHRGRHSIWWSLLIAIPAGSTAVLFIKASALPALWLAASRLLIAAIIIAPLAMRDQRRSQSQWSTRDILYSLIPALALAIHFALWIIGARMTIAVDAALIGNLLPIALPMVVFTLLRELPNRREMLACGIGVLGVLIMGLLAARHGGVREAHGDELCGLSVIGVAIYLTLARRLRKGSLWVYLTPLYGFAGIFCAIMAWYFQGPPPVPHGREILLMLGLAIFPTVIAHSIYNRAMSEIRPNILGVLNLMQCPLAGFAAWLLWKERPSMGFYVASLSATIAFLILMYPMLAARFVAPVKIAA
jgi:drug/metabolite transporter (DMT)-like permease